MLKSEIEAEEVEKKAKEELKNKNYETAFALFDEAKIIYEGLNLKGKSGFCDKQLVLIKKIMDYTKNAEEPLFDKMKVFKSESERDETLIEAEKRRNRLRQQSEIGMKEADLEQKYKRKLQMSKVQINKEYENRKGKLRIIQIKQEEK